MFELTFYLEYKFKKSVLLGQTPRLDMAYLSLDARRKFSGVNNEHKCK